MSDVDRQQSEAEPLRPPNEQSGYPAVDLLLKFGGSIATDPDTADRVNGVQVRALAEVVRDQASFGVVLVHGTGHVGKPAAIQHGFQHTGRLDADRREIALGIKNDLADLNTSITAHLLATGVPALSMHAEDVLPVEPGREITQGLGRLLESLEAGLVPVLYGDMVRTECGGWRVLSSDEILVHLARQLRPRLTAFLSDVDGVFGTDDDSCEGAVIATLAYEDDARIARQSSDERDVSGGMTVKIHTAREAARHSGSCHILNGARPDRLRDLVDGRITISTLIVPSLQDHKDGAEQPAEDPAA